MTAVLKSEPDPAGMCLVAYQKEGVVSLILILEILFLYAATALMTNILVTQNLEWKLTR